MRFVKSAEELEADWIIEQVDREALEESGGFVSCVGESGEIYCVSGDDEITTADGDALARFVKRAHAHHATPEQAEA